MKNDQEIGFDSVERFFPWSAKKMKKSHLLGEDKRDWLEKCYLWGIDVCHRS